jgi:hypothetical protein
MVPSVSDESGRPEVLSPAAGPGATRRGFLKAAGGTVAAGTVVGTRCVTPVAAGGVTAPSGPGRSCWGRSWLWPALTP